MKIELAEQVRQFIRLRPPQPRRWLREGLRQLAEEKRDIQPRRDKQEGYYRLRVRSYRIIFRYVSVQPERKIYCDFVEGRDVVYEAFLNLLH